MSKNSEGKPDTYRNPVYPRSFPDPFVLKFRGEYFAYSTGQTADGNVFAIIGCVQRALKQAGQDAQARKFVQRAFAAHSYDEVLRLCFEYVEVR